MGNNPPNTVFLIALMFLFFSLSDILDVRNLTHPSEKREIFGEEDSDVLGFTEGGISPVPIAVGGDMVCWIEYLSDDIFCLSSSELIEVNNQQLPFDNFVLELPKNIGKDRKSVV